MLSWFIVICIFIFLLLCLSVWYSRVKVRRLFNNAIGVFGTMGKGKDALMVGVVRALYSKSKGKRSVYSNIPVLLKGKSDKNGGVSKGSIMSNLLNPDFLRFAKPLTPFPYKDGDIIYFSEGSLMFPSDEYKTLTRDSKAMGSVQIIKFIRHLFEGTFIINEQHPNRIWVQVREKLHSFVKIDKMTKGFIFLKFNITIYSQVEDYGKYLPTKREIKKGVPVPMATGEINRTSLRFFKKSIFGKYNTRAYQFLAEIKKANYKVNSPNDPVEDLVRNYEKLPLQYDDLKDLGINKFDDIFDEYEKLNKDERGNN